jgi:prepilin-type N-terminal cleavage/methylation domain-containing protein
MDRRLGFSLVELMVAVAVMAIVTSQLLLSFSQQHTSSLEHERVIEIQQEARLVENVILKDLRSGGFMVPKYTAVASRDGGAAGPDALCVSDASVLNDATLPAATEKFSGAMLLNAFNGPISSVAFANGSLDIDSDGDNDFAVGSGLIIGVQRDGHCAAVTGITVGATTTTINFSPASAASLDGVVGDPVVPAVIYSVAGTNLSRNSVVLSNHIEDLQVEFGIDADRNGTVEGLEFPIDDLNGSEYELVRIVRVHITARNARAEVGFAGQFPAVANRVAGAADNFKRRRITGDAILRNLR